MKLLHLYSDWKWTGPAEPAMQACRSLMDLGHEVIFACCEPPPDYPESVKQKALELGLNVVTQFKLNRYMNPWHTVLDLWRLPFYMRKEAVDIVHCHLSHDHGLATRCTHWPWSGRPPLVRSLYKRTVLPDKWLNRLLLQKYTDGCVTFTASFRDQYIQRFNLPAERVAVSPMTIDLERFNPAGPHSNMRQALQLPADAPVIGIVGRFQKYRRADVFMQAARLTLEQVPEARFVIIGRSSQLEETVVKPMRELGIEDRVALAGYRREDYVDTLAALDIFSLLMPGFDGTARAVREAMALGIPCVVADYGMLPEMVPHEEAGLVVPIEPEQLAAAWLQLIRHPEKRQEMGRNARAYAEKNFQISAVGPVLEKFYRQILEQKKTRRSAS